MDRVSRSISNSADDGFTLVELMVTVAIVSILAVVAVPAFNSYLNKSRAQEAIDFLSEIKLRQESYRAEFGQYCHVNAKHPLNDIHGSTPVPWTPAPDNWNQLGAHPEGEVRFNYDSQAGLPGTVPNDTEQGKWQFPGNDFWFWARATGDLNNDGVQVTFDIISGRKNVWCSSARGWD